MIIASGWRMPAAMPWATRARVSTFSFGASPPTTDATENSASEPMKVARTPIASLSQALSSMEPVIAARKPVDIHCAWSCPIPKTPMMSGRATLTTVEDSTTVMVAIMVVVITSHR